MLYVMVSTGGPRVDRGGRGFGDRGRGGGDRGRGGGKLSRVLMGHTVGNITCTGGTRSRKHHVYWWDTQ